MNLFHFRGFSLLEVLVACFILSFGLLGILGVYVNSFKRTEDLFRQTLAFSQLISMKENKQECFACKNLLPDSECRCDRDSTILCWDGGQDKRCLKL